MYHELKSCPFCGRDNIYFTIKSCDFYTGYYGIECDDCKAGIYDDCQYTTIGYHEDIKVSKEEKEKIRKELAERWNRRA